MYSRISSRVSLKSSGMMNKPLQLPALGTPVPGGAPRMSGHDERNDQPGDRLIVLRDCHALAGCETVHESPSDLALPEE